MKKILMVIISILCLAGCGKKTTTGNLVENLGKKINNIDCYKVEATMTVKRDNSDIVYDLEIINKKDYYVVKLISRENNNVQVILKNEEGVFVLNPTINKCFKFNSNWPTNSSNGYLLSSIIKDIINDDNNVITKDKDNYYVTSKVSHKTKASWVNQKVTLNKDSLLPKEVVIMNAKNEVILTVNFGQFNLHPDLEADTFNQEKLMNSAIEMLGEGPVGAISSGFNQPTYLPAGTILGNNNLTATYQTSVYTGDNPFILSQSVISASSEMEYINVYGDIVILDQGVASVTGNTLSWNTSGVEYIIFSKNLSADEMISIANSFVE